ncbi:cytochrome-c peroxidase [Photobacterium japonica]|uniref:cytochrome-c peroxidase n=1 Tax=Photobacterium japonica TaxID=2910235 RepID=UPI003D1364D7
MNKYVLGLILSLLVCVIIGGFLLQREDPRTHASMHVEETHARKIPGRSSSELHRAPSTDTEQSTRTQLSTAPRTDTLIQPIPFVTDYDLDSARVGWQLFHDPNLSSNRKVSCATCHDLTINGAEEIPVSTGVNGAGSRNSMTVFNVAYNVRFFWDGRSNSLGAQMDGPIHNPLEMDSNWPVIVDYVSHSPRYKAAFDQLGLVVSAESIRTILVDFQRTLATPNAPFDRYLRGEDSAITPAAKRGWLTFQKEGCVSCHQGINVGGSMVMKFGFFGIEATGKERNRQDKGRYELTSAIHDVNLFRVASLRNVAITAPYFHDGRTASLTDAIQIMAKSQLGKDLDKQKLSDIEAFLQALTGERPAILEEFENEQ